MKKGYTLIEIIITLSIISILTSIISLGSNYYKKTADKIENQAILTEVKAFLSFTKSYCRSKGERGEIFIDENGEYIKFICFTKEVKSINFYDDFSIGSNSDNKIEVDSEGIITKSVTISIYRFGKYIGEITIDVGVGSIRVYESDIIKIEDEN